MLKQILTSLELFQTISWTAFFSLCHTFHPAALHKDLKKEKTCFLKQQLHKRLIPVMTSVLNSARKPRCESFVKVTWKNRMLFFLFALLVKQEAKDVSLFSLWIWCWFISLHGAKYDFFNFFLEGILFQPGMLRLQRQNTQAWCNGKHKHGCSPILLKTFNFLFLFAEFAFLNNIFTFYDPEFWISEKSTCSIILISWSSPLLQMIFLWCISSSYLETL